MHCEGVEALSSREVMAARRLPVRGAGKVIIWCDFDSLCAGYRSHLDYLELADRWHGLILDSLYTERLAKPDTLQRNAITGVCQCVQFNLPTFIGNAMPIVKIDEQGPRSAQDKAQLVATVFKAIQDAAGVSPGRLQARYHLHAAEDFFPPPGIPGAGYVAIEISLFAGRSLEVKRQLYARIAQEVGALRRIDPAHVLVLLREEPLENWGMQGGRAAIGLTFD